MTEPVQGGLTAYLKKNAAPVAATFLATAAYTAAMKRPPGPMMNAFKTPLQEILSAGAKSAGVQATAAAGNDYVGGGREGILTGTGLTFLGTALANKPKVLADILGQSGLLALGNAQIASTIYGTQQAFGQSDSSQAAKTAFNVGTSMLGGGFGKFTPATAKEGMGGKALSKLSSEAAKQADIDALTRRFKRPGSFET